MSGAYVVNKSIDIDAPTLKVWEVLTTPDLIRQWLSESAIDTISDWKAGSSIIQRGNLHGIKFQNKGTILQFEPEKVLKYTQWSNISRLPDSPENYSLLEFQLTWDGKCASLMLTHSNLVTEVMYKHVNFYWNTTLNKLKKLIENHHSFDRLSVLTRR